MTTGGVPPSSAGAGPIDAATRDRLAAAKLWLTATQSPTSCGGMPYLATALYALVPVVTARVDTATVDPRWRLYLNPDWVAATDVPVLAGRLAHLVWHLLSDHPERAQDVGVRPDTAPDWSTAADAAVADMLDSDQVSTGLASPQTLGLPEGRSVEEYFALLSGLPAEPVDSQGEPPGDEHSPGPDPTCGSGCDGLPRSYELPPSDESMGSVGQAHADDIRRRVAIEFTEHQTSIGTLPGPWSRWVEEILDPVVPWHQVLESAVRRGVGWVHGQTDYTYTRVSRRQAAAGRIVLPATRRPVPRVAVVVDTSGSMDDGLLSQALGEVDGVLTGLGVKGDSVTVLATDAAVSAVSQVRSAAEVRLGGGGGTDMRAGISAALELKPRPSLVVVLTDGFTPWPAVPPPVPVVAVLIGRSRAHLPDSPDWVQRVECVP